MARDQLTAGVDLGGTKIQTVVLRGAQVVGSARVLTPTGGAEAVMAAMVEGVRTALKAAKARPASLARVGIGSPGKIDTAKGVVSLAANVAGFEGSVAVCPAVSKALGGVPVIIDNDVRVAILGEFEQGAGRPFQNLLGVAIGTGVGGGIVLGGKLLEGRGAAGEIGHTLVKEGGRRCSCGRRGCLEAYAGRGCMEVTARRWKAAGRRTVLFDLMLKKGRDRLASGVFAAALKKHDPVAERLIDQAVWALGIALANAQNLLDLEAIMIGGGLGDRLGQPFADRVTEAMKPNLFVPDKPPQVLASQLGDLAGAIGAALRAREG